MTLKAIYPFGPVQYFTNNRGLCRSCLLQLRVIHILTSRFLKCCTSTSVISMEESKVKSKSSHFLASQVGWKEHLETEWVLFTYVYRRKRKEKRQEFPIPIFPNTFILSHSQCPKR